VLFPLDLQWVACDSYLIRNSVPFPRPAAVPVPCRGLIANPSARFANKIFDKIAATGFYRPSANKLYIHEIIDTPDHLSEATRTAMSIQLGIVMDPIGAIKIHKDSSFAMLLAAQKRGWRLFYMEQSDLYLRDGQAFADMRELRVTDQDTDWFQLLDPQRRPVAELDVVLLRKDPPMDMEYLYTCYILETAEYQGVLVVNRPASVRDCNEKLFTGRFPHCCAPSMVSRDSARLRTFIGEQGDAVLKPLDAMGGASVFRVRHGDPNTSVILETLTELGQRSAMAQRFIPEISLGDKRILMIDGEPVPYALARIPAHGETRGNLAAGGRGEGIKLSERDYWICEQVAPELRQRGLLFVGLDVIGDYLTEINVTSPTCIRELDQLYGLDIAGQLMDCIENKATAIR
jgi:glutathione synthase